MKITSKSRVTANQDITAKSKSDSMKKIQAAIEILGESARRGDQQSKDAIANLSVILFDLQDN